MKFLRIAVIAGLAALVGYKYFTADPPGYCAAQGRYISDEEFIKASEAMLAWRMKEKLERQKRWAAESPGGPFSKDSGYVNSTIESAQRKQADIEANRKRPGFTKVDRDETHTIFRWLVGYQQLTVTLNAKSGDDQSRYVFDVCGNVLEGGPSGTSTRNILKLWAIENSINRSALWHTTGHN
jgi:hypothetical protein